MKEVVHLKIHLQERVQEIVKSELLVPVWLSSADSCTYYHGRHDCSLCKDPELHEVSCCAHGPSVSVAIHTVGNGGQHSGYTCNQW